MYYSGKGGHTDPAEEDADLGAKVVMLLAQHLRGKNFIYFVTIFFLQYSYSQHYMNITYMEL